MNFFRVVVFASGDGSNFEALARVGGHGPTDTGLGTSSPEHDADDPRLGSTAPGRGPRQPSPAPDQRERTWHVVGLITNRPDAGAVARAESMELPFRVIPTVDRPEAEVSQDILSALSELRTDIVCLAGYLRLVPTAVVQRFRGRIVNIHPGPLPRFGGRGMYGMRVHEAVISAGVSNTAVTVHHVVEEYDRGTEILRRSVRILPRDTPASLARRVLTVEHFLYPLAVDRLCSGLPGTGARGSIGTRRALISVSDKTGVVTFAQGLIERGFEIVSTGGTAEALRSAGVAVTEVTKITAHPEMLDGRVKTLHPAVHAGILWRRGIESDRDAMALLGYGSIDLVAVNLYPFRETAARGDASMDEVVEQIDVGGPSMLRAAAKAHRHVWVVPDPGHYDSVLDALDNPSDGRQGDSSGDAHRFGPADRLALRRVLASATFRLLSGYDLAIAEYLAESGSPPLTDPASPPLVAAAVPGSEPAAAPASADPPGLADRPALPDLLIPRLKRIYPLRYGENPDQAAALYANAGHGGGIPAMRQLHGRELSYNNILDLDGALLSVSPFRDSGKEAAVIVKHASPCGIAVADSLVDAYRAALATDPESAFGSVIAVNRVIDEECAEEMSTLFIECLAAPGYTDAALDILGRKKNIRLLAFAKGGGAAGNGLIPSIRSVAGGALAQTAPLPPLLSSGDVGWRVASERAPTEREASDLRFAWCAVFGVKSNAILIARGGAALGIGGGQTSRVESSRVAVARARRSGFGLNGAVMASDGFFPFRDGVDEAAEAGVTAIVQPGGSKRDEEVVAAANEHGLAMVMTGHRVFRH